MSNMYKRNAHKALEINRLKTLNEIDKTFKALNRDNGDTSPQTAGNHSPRKWKTINCNFDVRFCVSLKTAFSKLS